MTQPLCLEAQTLDLQTHSRLFGLASAPVPPIAVRTHRAAALLAAHDEVLLGLMGSALENAGYEVAIERDGFAALERLRKTPFRLAVLDLHLPRRTGWEVLQGLQRLAQRPKVMVTTSQQGRLLEQRLRACGCDELLHRPFARNELVTRLERLLPTLH